MKNSPHRTSLPQDKVPELYELGLLLADGQSNNSDSGLRWAEFVDHLSRICDEFAGQGNARGVPGERQRLSPEIRGPRVA